MFKKLDKSTSDCSLHDDTSLWASITLTATPIYTNKVPYTKIRKINNNLNTSLNNKYTNHYTPPIYTKPNSTHDISSGSNLNNNTKKKIDQGKYHIDSILDLHGYTLDAAYNTLMNFIIKNYNSANKLLLIITGWGSTDKYNSNSIKSNFSKWLQSVQIANLILYYREANRIHGGKGAFYVLLKSKNKKI
ncbi:smr domain protein [Ehrlichia chaffeensis str. Heartland]|uniref:Smr domain protein n=1 Tax=Ehrlichia chaffeensis (strain ATCC CRL-10679 / Arkansas) TaxID=205920 RepID=Q2GG38_EHRCR|nr:Smr/MutS family protein [Ehrlichia chaffeensis]ABD44848.1 Smr domain protein [Ehrlichia chaffeensis str. Arkansas]AHX03855.1 smr domain protein [Ehrlichia chaffeensis str. Heartland]AHX05420.1 smr domain protein [Ehrlichia chaffeensis str. Jax]AHX06407.1 smr domain protein [Ehrlichia chaffeensis str. Liberty]AHX07480.1 smr domain protein [Ehrlichia chaffeensis str. Osceola]